MTVLKVTRSLHYHHTQSKLYLFTRVMLFISIVSLVYIVISSSLSNFSSSTVISSSDNDNQVTGDGAKVSASSALSDVLSDISRNNDNQQLHGNIVTSGKLTASKNNLTNGTTINGQVNTPRKHSFASHRIKGPKELFSVNDGIQVPYYVDNCGLNHDCPRDHFSLHLFTGFENQIYPKLCIDGKYLLDKGVNGAARGINVAIIDSITKAIISVSNFDTYDKDSTALETLLLTVRDGDIVILLTFDEPSAKLSHVARLLLAQLGSGKAQNINYRTSWYMVSQKGISGYTPYEEIHLPSLPASSFSPVSSSSSSSSSSLVSSSPSLSSSTVAAAASLSSSPSSSFFSPLAASNLLASSSSSSSSSSFTSFSPSSSGGSSLPKSAWGLPHDVKTCLPLSFDGVAIQADDTIRENSERKKFCRLFAHIWPLFCESHIINDPLVPSSVMRLAVSVELFKTPIIIMTPPESIHLLSDLTLTLETLLRQPGIEARNVIVFYNSTCCESVKHLVNLFGFMSAEYTSDRFAGRTAHSTHSTGQSHASRRFSWNSADKSNERSKTYQRNNLRYHQLHPLYNKLAPMNDSSDLSTGEMVNNSSKINLFKDCLQTVHLLFPEAQQFILIESHLILSPDFLTYFGQMLPLLHRDSIDDSFSLQSDKIVAISAWNENGFATSSSDASIVYAARVDHYRPRLAAMIPRIRDFDDIQFPESLFWSLDQQSTRVNTGCRRNKFIYNHTVDCNSLNSGYIVFPDVSRVSLIVPQPSRSVIQLRGRDAAESIQRLKSFSAHYMTSARKINLNEDVKISNSDALKSIDSYKLMLRTLIDQSSASFKDHVQSAIDCIENMKKPENSKCKSGKNVCIVTVFVTNAISYDRFCKYFNLINCKEHITLDAIGRVVRFTVPYNIQVILIDQTDMEM